MSELLRCGARIGFVVLAMAGVAAHAGEPQSIYSRMAQEKLNAHPLRIDFPPAAINFSRPTAQHHQSLRLDCEKIGQAQSALKDARRRGARLIPAGPADSLAGVLPTRDEIYHVSRNEERLADLARQFQCGR